MLEDILDSVTKAEQEGSAAVARAEEEAAAAIRTNQQQIDDMWEDVRARAKSRRAGALSEAEVHATRQAEHIAADYDAQCNALRVQGAKQVDGLVTYLTEIIFNGNC